MKARWAVAAVAVLALVFLTMRVPMLRLSPSWWSAPAPKPATTENSSCPAETTPANLSFALKDMHDREVRLSDYKGKVLLIDFWATWCEPCKAEIPHFVELQTKYGERGFQVLGISVDDPVDKLKAFAAEYKMNYPVLQGLGHDDVQDAYGPMWGIPVSVVVNRDGCIVKKHMGVAPKEVFEQEITSLL